MFWLRVLALAKVALLVRHHLALLTGEERRRLARLVADSRGRPTRNLSTAERGELLRLVQKLEPARFGRTALFSLGGRARGRP